MGKSLVSCFLTHSVYTDDGDDDDDDAEARAAARQIELNHDERNNEPKPVNTCTTAARRGDLAYGTALTMPVIVERRELAALVYTAAPVQVYISCCIH